MIHSSGTGAGTALPAPHQGSTRSDVTEIAADSDSNPPKVTFLPGAPALRLPRSVELPTRIDVMVKPKRMRFVAPDL